MKSWNFRMNKALWQLPEGRTNIEILGVHLYTKYVNNYVSIQVAHSCLSECKEIVAKFSGLQLNSISNNRPC